MAIAAQLAAVLPAAFAIALMRDEELDAALAEPPPERAAVVAARSRDRP
jgi:hypothetical protein